MILKDTTNPQHCVSTDKTREPLLYVHLSKEDETVVGTDGRMLVASKVETEPEDSSGPVPPEAFKKMRQRGSLPCIKANGSIVVHTKDGSLTSERPTTCNYPNWKQVLPPSVDDSHRAPAFRVALDAALLYKIAQGMTAAGGGTKTRTVELVFQAEEVRNREGEILTRALDRHAAITVYPTDGSESVGVIMPLRGSDTRNAESFHRGMRGTGN